MRIKFITGIMIVLLLFTPSVYAFNCLHYAKNLFRSCKHIAQKSIELSKKHTKLSIAFALSGITIFLAHKLKHNCISLCALSGRVRSYKFWHAIGGRIDPRSEKMREAFFGAVQTNNIRLACLLLSDGIDVNDNQVFPDRTATLHEASRLGLTKMATLLLTRGADRLLRDRHNKIALHRAAEYNRSEIVQVLLAENGTREDQLRAQDGEGKTALHVAAEHGSAATAALLIENGAALEGTTQLHSKKIAAQEIVNPMGLLRPLHLAAQKGDAETIKVLLDHGAERRAVDAHEKTPLDYARLVWNGFAKKRHAIRLLEEQA